MLNGLGLATCLLLPDKIIHGKECNGHPNHTMIVQKWKVNYMTPQGSKLLWLTSILAQFFKRLFLWPWLGNVDTTKNSISYMKLFVRSSKLLHWIPLRKNRIHFLLGSDFVYISWQCSCFKHWFNFGHCLTTSPDVTTVIVQGILAMTVLSYDYSFQKKKKWFYW